MNVMDIRAKYEHYQQTISDISTVQAAADVLQALTLLPYAVDLVFDICHKQSETLAALDQAADRGDEIAIEAALTKLFIYNAFFVDWMTVDL